MQLQRNVVCNKIEIKSPRWKQRVVGIAAYRVGTHNEVEIVKTDKDGKRYYPDKYYISGDNIKRHDKQVLPSGVVLYLVPIIELEILERI
jgi:hypothetical protein